MIKFDLNNRVAIVTGGAQGFGLAITERFIESGAKVIIWDIDESEAKKALEKVNSENLTYQIVDVSNYETINAKLSEVEKSHGKIDIFVNNAGVAGMNTTVTEYPIEEWNKVINLNLNAVFYCCKAVVPFMVKNNYGRIVNIASIAGKEGNPNASAYSTSKAAILGLTQSFANELGPRGIRVNAIAPGIIDTPGVQEQMEPLKAGGLDIDTAIAANPLRIPGKPDYIARSALFLVSDLAEFITGHLLVVDGGSTA